MLFSKKRSAGWRVATVLGVTAAVTLFGVVVPAAGARLGWWGWPEPSSRYGVLLGVVGGLIVLFEMALYPRKVFRGVKGFPAVLWSPKLWLRAHVVLGFACFPVIMVHAGYGFGGPLPRVTLVLFLLTIASGVYGLVLQQWLPGQLIEDIPGETVASQIDKTAGFYVGRRGGHETALGHDQTGEVFRLVESLIREQAEFDELTPPVAAAGLPDRGGDNGLLLARFGALVTGQAAKDLQAFRDGVLVPYLERGADARSPLANRAESERRFARLRSSVPAAAHPAVDRLEQLAGLRRRWDFQARINRLLHNWIPVHLGLSVAMTGLMLVHAVRALKYW